MLDRQRRLTRDEWPLLREIRLAALLDSPCSFLATYELEIGFDEARWRAEFTRGHWDIGFCGGKQVGMLGVTREPTTPPEECYLEYVWVAPQFRRYGIALDMLQTALDDLAQSGVRTTRLWVLDGNESARNLYKRLGFVSTGKKQPLVAKPGRYEELMSLELEQIPCVPVKAVARSR